jgi:hypothetical protein
MRNLRLDGDPLGGPKQVVGWHGAMQAQEYVEALWSVGQRATQSTAKDVERAVADGSIVRTHALRPTWHFLARDDARWIVALTGPRVQRQLAARYRDLGLDPPTLARSQRAILKALEGGTHLTRKQLAVELVRARIDIAGQRLPHMLMHAELDLAICSGARVGRDHTYAVFDDRVPDAKRMGDADAARALVERYLRSHGPSSVHDLRWWSGLRMAEVRSAIDDLDPMIEAITIGNHELWRMPGSPPGSPAAVVTLLETFDEYVVGYTRTRFLGDPRADVARAAWGGRDPYRGPVLRSGRIVGRWRRRMTPASIGMEVRTYGSLGDSALRRLRTEVRRFGRFHGREVTLEVGSATS